MVNDLLKLAKEKNLQLEVVVNEEQNTEIETFNKQVSRYEISNVKKYNLKGYYNKKIVKLTTEDISNPEFLISELINNSEIIDNIDKTTFAKKIDITNNDSPNIPEDYNKIIENFINLDKYRKDYPNLTSINMYYTHRYNKRSIINNEVELIDSTKATYVFGELVWTENGINQTGQFSIVGKDYDNDKVDAKIIESIEDMKQKIKAISCKSARYNVIIKNQQMFQILNTYVTMFDAEKISNKLSPLNDDYSKQVFSSILNIVEDPLNRKLIGSRLFDDEGNKTYYKEIIKNGNFVVKLYNNKMAIKENVKPTGTSGGVRNLYILPGSKSFQELVNNMNNGIIIDDVNGLNAGANTLNGDLSLQANGYEVKDGKIVNALKLIILQTNIKELFNNIIAIGNDLEFYSETGGSPSILCKDIMIVGKE